jgi:hypothetical protein
LKPTFRRSWILLASAGLLSALASADQIPIGYVSWNVTSRTTGEFDILNQTGPNSSDDPTWPVATTISLESLSLTVDFSNSKTEVFGPAYFSLGLDGISLDGATIPTGLFNTKPIDATLTGTFSPTVLTLFDDSTESISPAFSVTIESSAGTGEPLLDGNLAIIEATTIPEPRSLLLVLMCLSVLAIFAKIRIAKPKALVKDVAPFAIVVCLVLLGGSHAWADASVKLDVATAPSFGGAGETQVNITGSGFPPSVTAPDVVVTIANTCGGTVAATTTAMSVQVILGDSDRIHFLLPHALGTNVYFVSVASPSGMAPAFTSSNCSKVEVTHTTVATFCAPGSSLGVHAPLRGPAAVTAYVPNAAWRSDNKGLVVKQIEPKGGSPTPGLIETPIGTRNPVNSCGVNPLTGKAVCTANNTDVYILRGHALTNTLTSGSTDFAPFSGGSCMNCGLAIDGVKNLAVINLGLKDSPSKSGIQFLNLHTETFDPPIALIHEVSEDITIDPGRDLIVSPDEQGVYDLLSFTKGGDVTEFGHGVFAGEFDSAAEDCTTGIGLSSIEFTQNVYLADFTQGKFTAGTPGTWSAPQVVVPLKTNPYPPFAAGTSGIAVAPGFHLAAVSGEFGGKTIAVLQLPHTSGSGTPALIDYAVAVLPDGYAAGLDPHTMTAYTSPNNGKPYGLFSDAPPVTGLWAVDLEALLSAPRDPANPNAVDPTYDLVAHHIVTIIPLK